MKTARIGLSGPTGSGKTTLAGVLARHPEVALVEEPAPDEELRGFSLDPRLWCFRLERSILLGRGKLRVHGPEMVTVFDRTVDEDIEVFVRLHHERGFLSDSEVAKLAHLAQDVRKRISPPDLYVFMNAPLWLLARRIAAARAPNPVQASLERQVTLYDEWRHRLRAPILDLDTGTIGPQGISEIADWILLSLSGILGKGERTRGPYGIAWSLTQAK